MEVSVSVYQGLSELGDVEANTRTIERVAQKVSVNDRSSILLFPEMFLTGYEIGRRHLHLSSQVAESSSFLQRISAAAKANKIAICVGYPEKVPNGEKGWTYYNSAILYDENGLIVLNYRKSHLWKVYEDKVFSPGSTLKAADLKIGQFTVRVGILICYDVEFPEAAKLLHIQGAELILVPTALDNAPLNEIVPNCSVPARALENNAFIMYSNFAGVERTEAAQHKFKLKKEVMYCGRSAIISPFGEEISRAKPEANDILITGKLNWSVRKAAVARNPYLTDRRSEMYGSLRSSL
jgi:predicted amidohydrolase